MDIRNDSVFFLTLCIDCKNLQLLSMNSSSILARHWFHLALALEVELSLLVSRISGQNGAKACGSQREKEKRVGLKKKYVFVEDDLNLPNPGGDL